jgi:hypothetical protein
MYITWVKTSYILVDVDYEEVSIENSAVLLQLASMDETIVVGVLWCLLPVVRV